MAQMRYDAFAGCRYETHIGAFVIQEGRRNADDKGVCGLRLLTDCQVSWINGSLYERAQTRFMNVDLWILQAFYDSGVNINTMYFDAIGCKGACGWKANIS